jgi:uncharacterized protein (TIGR02001 family)
MPFKRVALFLALGLLAPGALFAQTFSLGTDVVSRYIWRGTDFGESLSFQPSLSFGTGGFEIGTWASYSVSADGAGANEHDLWAGYTIDIGNESSFSFGVTDYYFPAPDTAYNFFDYSGDGEGAHWIEPYVSYTGPATFPVTLYGTIFAHNDPDNSIYLEASYPFSVEGVDLGLTLGAVANESAFYGTEGFAFVNLGLSASKEVALSESCYVPVSVAYIHNPDAERSLRVVGFSISP